MTLLKNITVIGVAALALLYSNISYSASRVKDIVYVEGVRDNILVGYGLVVGLNGTGDNLKNSTFTEKGLMDFLSRVGINTKGDKLKTKNVAAVTVTATLPAFARHGTRIDVVVSTLGDAKSLDGGTLLATPLLGADGNVYSVAQGQIAIGGFTASAESGSSVSKGVPTSGLIANGGIVEREVAFDLNSLGEINLSLRNPDISTAKRISSGINDALGEEAADAIDPGTVALKVPDIYKNEVVRLLSDIEQVVVEPDQHAKVVIDEKSGTVVIGEDVKVDTIAVAQGNLVVTISEGKNVSQPPSFAGDKAETVVTDVSSISVEESIGKGLSVIRQGANLKDLVTGLNALGVGPRDLITILETIKSAGALQAEIETR